MRDRVEITNFLSLIFDKKPVEALTTNLFIVSDMKILYNLHTPLLVNVSSKIG